MFKNIQIGAKYSRQQLAELWDYTSFHAIARGVITPKGKNKIILFVTEGKQASQEQYQDRLDGNILSWQGPTDHFAEQRMVSATSNGDEVHLFHRDRHHTDFTYVGELSIKSYELRHDRPSSFLFEIERDTTGEQASVTRVNWTHEEIELVVEDYFNMRSMFLCGEPFVKARHYEAIVAATGRSKGSVERKYMNISATLERLSLPWLPGYAPLRNFQGELLKVVEKYVAREWNEEFVPIEPRIAFPNPVNYPLSSRRKLASRLFPRTLNWNELRVDSIRRCAMSATTRLDSPARNACLNQKFVA